MLPKVILQYCEYDIKLMSVSDQMSVTYMISQVTANLTQVTQYQFFFNTSFHIKFSVTAAGTCKCASLCTKV